MENQTLHYPLNPARSITRWLAQLCAFIACAVLLCACSVVPNKPWVEPYERGHLEDKLMKSTRHAQINSFRQHIYRTTAASRGADIFNGGGSGSN